MKTMSSIPTVPIACAFLAAALAGTGCQDLHSLVTGDPFFAAPQGSPRVEIEVVVQTDDAFFAALDVPDRGALEQAVSEIVLSVADVGMRFYPILSSGYAKGDAHPAHVMVVRMQGLTVHSEQMVVEGEGLAPRVHAFVRSVDCTAHASVEKRRDDAPPLLVGQGLGLGRVRVKPDPAAGAARTMLPVAGEAPGPEPLAVPRQDVLDAVEEAVVAALRELVKPVDRDLAPPTRDGGDR